MVSLEHMQDITERMRAFREADFLCDARLVANNAHEFRAHSLVLAACSSVFRNSFRSEGGMTTIHLTGFDKSTVEIALDAMYSGQLILPISYYSDTNKLTGLLSDLQDLGLDEEMLNSSRTMFNGIECNSDSLHATTEECISGRNNMKDIEKMHLKIASVRSTETTSTNKETIVPHRSTCIDSDGTVLQQKRNYATAGGKDVAPRSVKYVTIVKISPNVSDNDHKQEAHSMENTQLCKQSEGSEQYLQSEQYLEARREDFVSNKMRAYVCKVCNKAFSQPNYLNIHMRKHSGEKPFSCDVCHQRFTQRANLLRHALTHTGQRPFLCHLCGKAFSQKITLQEHSQQVHQTSVRRISCKICAQGFPDRANLRVHINDVHPESCRRQSLQLSNETIIYTCRTCGKEYASSGGLRMHSRVHIGVTFACTTCGKTYVNASLLRQHIATHTREKEYKCETCNKSFIYRNALHVHRRVHSGVKPYRCDSCGRTFKQYAHLQSHARTHSGEKPFVCTECGKSYRQKIDLKNHKRRSNH